ncbi:MAG: hypothetical protein B7Y02_06930 [Rhodobacterales bacterium 17-64-5]|nr:MAG: hypothetical protein B7Y02_06930 [Rhodobacterales bacterium 17-64-5]
MDTLIGAGTQIHGDITFSGGLRIDGEIHGNVTASGEGSSTLVVSEHARVEGEVRVSHVVINGTVTGPVHCGRAYCGVPPCFARRSRKVGNSFRSAGALRGLSPEKPV